MHSCVDITNKKPDFVLASIAGADNARWDAAVPATTTLRDTLTAIPGGLISVTELISQANWLQSRHIWPRTRAPFFAHMNVPMMAGFVERYLVADTDGIPATGRSWLTTVSTRSSKALRKAGSIDTEKVKDAMKGPDHPDDPRRAGLP